MVEIDQIKRIEDTDLAIEMILQGVPRKQIKQVLMTKRGLNEGLAIDRYDEALAVIKESANIDRETELGKALRRLERLYYKLDKAKSYKDCLSVQKEINDLAGLRNITVKNINISGGKLSDDETNRILEELNLLKTV